STNGFPASEPVAAVSHPPAEHADRNRGQQRPHDRHGEIRHQSKRHESSPKDLALHSFILARAIAPSPPMMQQISRKNTWPNDAGRATDCLSHGGLTRVDC